MADAYLLKLDLERIAANLSAAERRPWSVEDVRVWLEEQGFVGRGDGRWVAEDVSLAALDPSEILTAQAFA